MEASSDIETFDTIKVNFLSYIILLKNSSLEIKQKSLISLCTYCKLQSSRCFKHNSKMLFEQIALLSQQILESNQGYQLLLDFLESNLY